MKLDKFPPVFKSELDQRTQQRLTDESNRSYQQQNSIKSSVGAMPDGSNWVIGCGMVGFVIGFFTCVSNCDGMTFWDVFGPWIMLTIGGLVVGGIISALINKSYDEKIQEMNAQISREKSRANTSRENIQKDAEKEYLQYVSEFETTAQKMSVRFAESPLAVEVIDWMTNGFAKTIDAADRRSHIQEINIPFVFRTYRNKIECNLGTFDFEIKRCDELETPLEQTALTRAIASAIQLNITMKYPQDASGTNVVTNIAYDYKNDNVMATIVYTAPNGNYKATRGWAVN